MVHQRLRVLVVLISLAGASLMLREFTVSADTAARPGVVTFAKDVAPIFFGKCAVCHHPGEMAPMSLLTYKDARPWAKAIKEKVLNRTMPPWHADPAYEKFVNDRSLSPKEIDTIVAWVDGGAREGDPKDLPPTPRFTADWKIGKPDVVFTMPTKFEVPAQGVLDYQYFSVPTKFAEDRWVQAAEVRPGNSAVVHHVIVFVEHPRKQTGGNQTSERDGGLESLAGVAPGEEPTILPDGVGMLLRAGSVLIFQMHYTPNGTAQSDQTSVGLIFNKKPVVKTAMGGAMMNTDFAIPPGDANYEVRSSYTFDEDCHLTSLMPHMHVRGKDFQYRLVYPDGRAKIILSVPRYDFNWQTRYEFAAPVAAPKGSRIESTAHFDNSPGNKANPDPTKLVRWGPQTWDEMMIGFFEFTLDRQNLQSAQLAKTGRDHSAQRAQPVPGPKTAERSGSAEALPTIEQILDQYVQAIGGKAAIQAQTSRLLKGTLKVPSFGAKGTIVIYAKAPNKELTEIASALLGNSRYGFNGNLAWAEENGEVNDQPAYAKRDADFYLPIKLRELYPRMELKAKEKVAGREAYCLEAPRNGRPKRWFFDTETGLLIRTEVRNAKGELMSSEDYDDYRAVDGMKIPFSIREIDVDGTEVFIKFSEVKHNVVIDDGKFDRPAARPTRALSFDNRKLKI